MEQATWNLEYRNAVSRGFRAQQRERCLSKYTPASPKPVYRPGMGTCDLHATMLARPAMVPQAAQVELRLADRT